MLIKSKIKTSSNRNFGFVFFIVFLILGFWPITNGEEIRIWLILLAFIFFILGIMALIGAVLCFSLPKKGMISS